MRRFVIGLGISAVVTILLGATVVASTRLNAPLIAANRMRELSADAQHVEAAAVGRRYFSKRGSIARTADECDLLVRIAIEDRKSGNDASAHYTLAAFTRSCRGVPRGKVATESADRLLRVLAGEKLDVVPPVSVVAPVVTYQPQPMETDKFFPAGSGYFAGGPKPIRAANVPESKR